MKTMKKVWRYIAKYKKYLAISIGAMLIVQVLGLFAPLIVKTILDDYLVGIERPWYQNPEPEGILYQNQYYTQDVVSDDVMSIIIYEGKYYAIMDFVESGTKSIEGNTLTIRNNQGMTYDYSIVLLSKTDVLNFYQPFINPIIVLLILLILRFFLQILFTYIQRISTMMINVNIVRDARLDAIKSLQKMPMHYFEKEPAGKIANRIINDVGGMMNLFSTIMNLLVNATMAIVFAYIGMF